jgi:hypothetical protein
MADSQLKCNIEDRRKAIVDSALNGIDYLEVVLTDPNCVKCKPYIVVYFFKSLDPAAPFNKDNVKIEGGVRVKNIAVNWAAPAAVYISQHKDMQKKLQIEDKDLEQALVVYPQSDGDFSTYTLRIVDSSSAEGTPPNGFDKLLSSITFSFKVDCPAEFDCHPKQECPPEPLQEPVIDYLSKDYASFRRLILDRISTIAPNWKERNPADAGVMMAELLAYTGDYLSYYQDAVATEAYLGTARNRISVKRHARLLDYFMHNGCNSRAWVCVKADDNLGKLILKGTKLLTGNCEKGFVVKPEDLEDEVSGGAKVFEVMQDTAMYSAHNEINFYTWGDNQCCLPKGATKATLADSSEPDKQLTLAKGDILVFEEIRAAEGREADKDVSHRHAVKLTNVTKNQDTLPVTAQPVVNIEWGAEDALPFPLCLSDKQSDTLGSIAVARGNVLLVDHGATILKLEKLVDSYGGQTFRPSLKKQPLTFAGPFDPAASAFSAFNYDPHDATPEILLRELVQPLKNEFEPITEEKLLPESWTPKPDLLDSNKFDLDFVVETENDGTATIRFGDNVHGMNPQEAPGDVPQLLYAVYRVGNGADGNVGRESIKRIVNKTEIPADLSLSQVAFFSNSNPPNRSADEKRISNPIAARGGVNPETLAEVRQNAPEALKINERAVTDADYAEILKRKCSDVQRAVARTRWTGSWWTVYVTVDRFGGKAIDEDFKAEVRNVLNRYRLSGYDVEVNSPFFVPLEIDLTVTVADDALHEDVKKALADVFSTRLLPDGQKGFFHPDNLTFGQPVYLSKISAVASQIDGVISVKVYKFHRVDKPGEVVQPEGIIEVGPFEIAQVETDPNYPERGGITFNTEAGR